MCVTGCDFRAIPTNLDPGPDQGISEEDTGRELLCTPNSSVCQGSDVLVCHEDGLDRSLKRCPFDQPCSAGACTPAKESCADGDVSIALSQTRMYFSTTEDLKSPPRTLSITNCRDTDITIARSRLLSVERRDGRQVFQFSPQSANTLNGSLLRPGQEVSATIEFRPREVEWVEKGELFLTFSTLEEGSTTRTVELRSEQWCLSTPSSIELPEVTAGETARIDLPVYNCGSRAVLLSGISPVRQMSADTTWVVEGLEKPLNLYPGDSETFTVEVTRPTAGPIDGGLALSLPPGDEARLHHPLRPIHVTGYAAAPTDSTECQPNTTPFEKLATRAASQDTDGPGSVYEAFVHADTEPPETVWPDGWSGTFSIHPREAWGPDPTTLSEQRAPPLAYYMPHTVGTYEMMMRVFDAQNRPLCEPLEQTVTYTAPREGYYVELTWYDPDAPRIMRDDEGRGFGPDLDLQVARPNTQQGATLLCDAAQGPGLCAQGGGSITATSQTGSRPEAIRLPRRGEQAVELRAYLRHIGIGERVCMEARIWRGEELMATVPAQETREADSARPCKGLRELQLAGSTWLIGTLDREKDSFSRQNSTF